MMHRYQNLQSGFARFLPPFLSLSLSFSTATPVSYTPRDRIDRKEGICPGQFRFELFAIFFILFPLVYTCVCVCVYICTYIRVEFPREEKDWTEIDTRKIFGVERKILVFRETVPLETLSYRGCHPADGAGEGRGDVAIRKWRRRLLRGTMPMRTYLFERILFNFFPLEIYLKFPCCTSNRFLLYRVEIFVSTLYSLIIW